MSIPKTYAEWRHCITSICKISLTPVFVQERLAIWSNPQHAQTERFRGLYGERQCQNILTWFRQAEADLQ
jgi:hypothetical protein